MEEDVLRPKDGSCRSVSPAQMPQKPLLLLLDGQYDDRVKEYLIDIVNDPVPKSTRLRSWYSL